MGGKSIKESAKSGKPSQKSRKEIKESKESLPYVNKNKEDFVKEILKYETILMRWALHLTYNKEESEDLIQETFYKALKNMNNCRDDTVLKTWLFTILKNTFLNNYRRQKNSPIVYTDDLSIINVTVNLTSIESDINRKEILSLFAKINKKNALTFKLYMIGYKYSEIASILNIPIGTVKSRVSYAREELMKLINQK
jgi:RNA polymerase sigma-70 factor, ECF subfamily